MILSDFHIHSDFSDGKHSIPEIVDFYGKRGFGAVAITDHLCETRTFLGKAAAYLNRTLTEKTFPRYLDILKREKQRAWEQYQMLLIPGFEITKNSLSNHRSAHILGIGITEWVDADAPIEKILAEIRAQGAITVAAHPLSTGKVEKQTLHLWNRRRELSHLFDAWEVGCGKHYFNEVADSGYPMIANTDLHRFSQIDGWKTLIEAEPEETAVLQAVREQKLTFHYYQEASGNVSGIVPFPQLEWESIWQKC